MRLIHTLCDTGACRNPSEGVLAEYFSWVGRTCPETLSEMLEELRSHDEVQKTLPENLAFVVTNKFVENPKSCAIIKGSATDLALSAGEKKDDDECA
jgi:hypothetical protein